MEKIPKKSKSKSKSKDSSKSASKSKEKKVNSPKKKTESKSKDKENVEKKEYPSLPSIGKFKFIHWNINGLRPLLKTKELDNLIEEENPDFICFNEIKVDNELIEKMSYKTLFKEKYISYFYPSEKKGYSGTAVFTKYKPEKITYGLNIKKHDNEGRLITLEYDKFYLICCYTPNAGENLKRIDYRVEEWDKDFFNYINNLKNNKDIILCGDLNVAYENIDIYEPKGHEKSPGFSKREKDSFKQFLNMGYIDTFRSKFPKEKKFSFFTKRGKNMKEDNKGWRLDYFVVNDKHKFNILDSDMLDKFKYNSSDHIPLYLNIEI
jgi:exodeoxyribonuclease III